MSVGCLTNFAEKDDPLQTKSCLENQNSKLEKCDSKTFIPQFPIKEESPTNNVVYYTLSKMFYQNVYTIMQLGKGAFKNSKGERVSSMMLGISKSKRVLCTPFAC